MRSPSRPGTSKIIKESIGGVTPDRRLQVLLIAFAFGAVLEGAGGGGGPVAICGSMMVGLGFEPFAAAMLCLMANTAPVAFGAVGNPVRTLVAVTGLGEADISAHDRPDSARHRADPAVLADPLGDQLGQYPAGLARPADVRRRVRGRPVLLVELIAMPALVDIMGGMITLVVLALFFKILAAEARSGATQGEADAVAPEHKHSAGKVLHAWSPFLLLSAFVIVWGMPPVKKVLDPTSIPFRVPGLHQMVQRVAPVVDKPRTEPAVVEIDWLAAVGHRHLPRRPDRRSAAGLSLGQTLRVFLRTCYRMRLSVLAIMAMLGLGYRHALLRHGRHHGPGHDAHRLAVSVLRHADRLAGRGAQRHRRRVERAVRQPAGDHGEPAGAEPGADGGGEFGGRRDGQDDLGAVDGGGLRGGRAGTARKATCSARSCRTPSRWRQWWG